RDGSAAFLIAECKRQTARVGDHRAHLPATDDLVDESRSRPADQVVLTEGQLVTAIGHNLILALELVPSLSSLLVPRSIGALEVHRTLPRVVGVERQPLGQLLRHAHLKSIEVGILIVAVELDSGIPSAGSRGKKRKFRLTVVGVLAGCQRAAVITL